MGSEFGFDNGRRRLIGGASAALLLAASWQAHAAADPDHSDERAAGEGDLRKRRSIARLTGESVPVIEQLPVIQTVAETRLRTPREVADRLLALTLVAVKADALLSGEAPQNAREIVQQAITQRKAQALFTPEERAFLALLRPSSQDQIRFQWRYEAAWVLLWALRWFDEPLLPPREDCDIQRLSRIVHAQTALASKGLRPISEILDEADLIYRYAWAADDARINNRPVPTGLSPDVIVERHQALNWLIRVDDAEWDAVPVDT